MAIFRDTPTVSFEAAVAKYPVRLLCLVLQPVAGLAFSAAWPQFDPWLSGAILLAAVSAVGWPVIFRDAPLKYWAAGALGWFAVELATAVASVAGVDGS